MKSLYRRIAILLVLLCWGTSGLGSPAEKGLYAEINTPQGTIWIELFFETAPVWVANFVGLINETPSWKLHFPKSAGKYSESIQFDRVIPGLFAQAGSSWNLGYVISPGTQEPLYQESSGMLSMINRGSYVDPGQFIITHQVIPRYDGIHPFFGKVIEGLDILIKMRQGMPVTGIRIVPVGDRARAFDPEQYGQHIFYPTALIQSGIDSAYFEKPVDPAKIPSPNQQVVDNVSLELLVVGYQSDANSPPLNLSRDQAKNLATQLTDAGRRKDVDFQELILRHSTLPQHNIIPSLQYSDALPGFLYEAFSLRLGQVSAPVDSPLGFVIYKRVSPVNFEINQILINHRQSDPVQSRSRIEALELAGQILEEIQSTQYYKINNDVFSILQSVDIPREYLARLKSLKGRNFRKKHKFLCAVRQAMYSISTKEYAIIKSFLTSFPQVKVSSEKLKELSEMDISSQTLEALIGNNDRVYLDQNQFFCGLAETLETLENEQFSMQILGYSDFGVKFKITPSTLEKIKNNSGFYQLLVNLETMRGQQFLSENTLLDAIEKQVGNEIKNRFSIIVLQHVERKFELTEDSIEQIQESHDFAGFLQKLRFLDKKDFQNKYDFDASLRTALGQNSADRYKKLIYKHVKKVFSMSSTIMSALDESLFPGDVALALSALQAHKYSTKNELWATIQKILGTNPLWMYQSFFENYIEHKIFLRSTDLSRMQKGISSKQITEKLSGVLNQFYKGRYAFIGAIERRIGKDATNRYKTLLLKKAQTKSGYKLTSTMLQEILNNQDFDIIIGKLQPIMDMEFDGDIAFEQTISQYLDAESLQNYRPLLKEYTESYFKLSDGLFSDIKKIPDKEQFFKKLAAIINQEYISKTALVSTVQASLGPYLFLWYKNVFDESVQTIYRINSDVIEQIAKDGDFDRILQGLKKVEGISFATLALFNDALVNIIGVEATERYMDLFAQQASIPVPLVLSSTSLSSIQKEGDTDVLLNKLKLLMDQTFKSSTELAETLTETLGQSMATCYSSLVLDYSHYGFAELAQKYSEASSSVHGGHLGMISQGVLMPEMENEILRLEPEEISDIIESNTGFHIIKRLR
ncbi:MAG: peptidylprolyl isomerase [SAR324 cluster bacterium]|nr:peptidylprolyl isomerase [SAR324 cluster bacterium]